MPEGGAIRVRAREERGKVCVTISDVGPGMQEQELSKLFDPFSGTGETALGLSIAWGVMSRLGGSLSATSRRGEGTTFTLTFPLATPQRREPPRRLAPERRSRRILIVDDEADNLDVLREVLELEGQEVETSRGGPEALALFDRGERFDLVLCDVGMPEMSGWQVARENPADRAGDAGVDADRLGERRSARATRGGSSSAACWRSRSTSISSAPCSTGRSLRRRPARAPPRCIRGRRRRCRARTA